MRLFIYISSLLLIATTGHLSVGQEGEAPLSLRLSLPQSSVCLGATEIQVQTSLVNAGKTPVRVRSKGFGRIINFSSLYDTGSSRVGLKTRQIVRDSLIKPTPEFRKIDPDDAYPATGNVSLDRDFFAGPGFYGVRISYSGDVIGKDGKIAPVDLFSNWAIFEVSECDGSKD